MKKIAKVLVGGILSTSVLAVAGPLRLDTPISLTTPSEEPIVTAFRDNDNCAVWRYVPGRYFASGSVLYDVAIARADFGQQQSLVSYSTMNMTAAPGITAAHIESLKNLILKTLASDEDCKDKVRGPSDLVLSPAFVQSKGAMVSEKRGYFQAVQASMSAERDVWFIPTNPLGIFFNMDASDPRTKARTLDIINKSQEQAVKLGDLSLEMEGVLNMVNSTLSLKGEMNAEFESAVKLIQCNTDESDQELGPGAFVKAAVMGGFGYSQSSKTCDYKLITNFKNGAYKSLIKFDHTKTKLDLPNGQPIMITTCNETGKCVAIPLQDFIEIQLFTLMIMTNYEADLKKISENTYSVSLGKHGNSKTIFDVTAQYMRRFDGKYSIGVPVYAYKIIPESLSALDSSQNKCFQENYLAQQRAYISFVNNSPLPVSMKCLGDL